MNYDNETYSQSTRRKGRSLSDFEPLYIKEKLLLRACRKGLYAYISNDKPKSKTRKNKIRGEFIRFLALGGDRSCPVHERGIMIVGGWIEGPLDLSHTTLNSSIDLRRCQFDSPIKLRSARITGYFCLIGSTVPGIRGDGLSLDGDLLLRGSFSSTRSVRFVGANIRGNFECDGSKFRSRSEYAVNLDNSTITGNVFLRRSFFAFGGVTLGGATIGGDLDCESGTFFRQKGKALACDRSRIAGEVYLCGVDDKADYFTSKGTIDFSGTHIEKSFRCEKSRIFGSRIGSKDNEIIAIAIDSAEVRKNVFIRNGTLVDGSIRMQGCVIKGGASLKIDSIKKESNNTLIDINATGAKIEGALKIISPDDPNTRYALNLRAAKAGELDDEIKSWGENIELDGFIYSSITGKGSTSAIERYRWLKKQKDFSRTETGPRFFQPQPWIHLQSVLRRMGHFEDSREIGIRFEKELFRSNLVGIPPEHWGKPRKYLYKLMSKISHTLFMALTGYGYRPSRLLSWFISIWISCSVFYWIMASHLSIFSPTNPLIFEKSEYSVCRQSPDQIRHEIRTVASAGLALNFFRGLSKRDSVNWYYCEALKEEYTGFNPLFFSLDVILPVVDLEQQKDWGVMVPTTKRDSIVESIFAPTWNHLARLVIWLQTLFGWIASLLLVAMVSGLTKRREE